MRGEPIRVTQGVNNHCVVIAENSSPEEEEFYEEEIDVDRFFDVIGVPENKQVKMLAINLKSIAIVWWDKLVIQRQRQSNGPIISW
ncbi:hypothetical protein KIW84_053371 [Lathyrus oleraceus]|uniref:Uncharacterized protein n=1 Tax=Pisum sativum TaxID=3888 RepID=A0A9D4WSM3_PEA|nr:hypothetical protein KIW84_053371 [Pisum sativum]